MTTDTIRQALECDNPACSCHRPTGHVHCPAHADSTPSLSVTEKDGKVLVKCHAGCSQDQVIAALRERANGRLVSETKKEGEINPPVRGATLQHLPA